MEETRRVAVYYIVGRHWYRRDLEEAGYLPYYTQGTEVPADVKFAIIETPSVVSDVVNSRKIERIIKRCKERGVPFIFVLREWLWSGPFLDQARAEGWACVPAEDRRGVMDKVGEALPPPPRKIKPVEYPPGFWKLW